MEAKASRSSSVRGASCSARALRRLRDRVWVGGWVGVRVWGGLSVRGASCYSARRASVCACGRVACVGVGWASVHAHTQPRAHTYKHAHTRSMRKPCPAHPPALLPQQVGLGLGCVRGVLRAGQRARAVGRGGEPGGQLGVQLAHAAGEGGEAGGEGGGRGGEGGGRGGQASWASSSRPPTHLSCSTASACSSSPRVACAANSRSATACAVWRACSIGGGWGGQSVCV